MGDRISMRFVDGEEKSPVLFSHWQGMGLIDDVRDLLKKLDVWIEERKANSNCSHPLDRKEVGTVLVDYVHRLNVEADKDNRVTSDYYLANSEDEGDNSDNGHFDIDVNTHLATNRDTYEAN